MSRYLFLMLSYPFFTVIGFALALIGFENQNIVEKINTNTILYTLYCFVLFIAVPLTLNKFLHLDQYIDRPKTSQSMGFYYIVLTGLVLISCIPFVIHGFPYLLSMNRYEYLKLEYVSSLRQVDTAITWFFVTSLVVFVRARDRAIVWLILASLAFFYGEKFSPIGRILIAEIAIRLYWRETLINRTSIILVGLIGIISIGGMTIYWWNGNLLDVISNILNRMGKQSSCTIAITHRIGFLHENFESFWNYYLARENGASFFHEISRALSTKDNHSILGDSFPCVYLAIGSNVLEVGFLVILFSTIKVLLLKIMFTFIDKIHQTIYSMVIVFLYARYLDSMLAADRFHLITHPVFIFSLCVMLFMIAINRQRKTRHA